MIQVYFDQAGTFYARASYSLSLAWEMCKSPREAGVGHVTGDSYGDQP